MKKKKALIAASVISCLFAAAAHLEWEGYRYFDRENGENLLCKVDPACRHLTEGEVKLAQGYFGNTIDYKNVKIFNRAFLRVFGHGHAGVTPNGHIYFTEEKQRSPNFAHEKYYDQKYLIHELVHVAQSQSGMDIPALAFFELLKHAFDYHAAYKYSVDTHLAFNEMNLEQQAQMMEDYSVKRSEFVETTTVTGRDGKTYRYPARAAEWVKEKCNEMSLYEIKFKGYYPVGRDELCTAKQERTGLKLKAHGAAQGLKTPATH